MSESNRLQIAKEIFHAFVTRADVEPLLCALADDAEFRLTVVDGTPLSGVFRGKEGVRQYFERNDEIVQTDSMEVLHYFTDGDRVAVVGRETLTVKRSGSVMRDSDWVTLITFRGDEIVKVLVVEDTSAISAAHR